MALNWSKSIIITFVFSNRIFWLATHQTVWMESPCIELTVINIWTHTWVDSMTSDMEHNGYQKLFFQEIISMIILFISFCLMGPFNKYILSKIAKIDTPSASHADHYHFIVTVHFQLACTCVRTLWMAHVWTCTHATTFDTRFCINFLFILSFSLVWAVPSEEIVYE